MHWAELSIRRNLQIKTLPNNTIQPLQQDTFIFKKKIKLNALYFSNSGHNYSEFSDWNFAFIN